MMFLKVIACEITLREICFAAANGAEFFCAWGGARTWGPKQLEEFGDYDRQFIDKAKTVFPHVFWHLCGRNLPQAMQMLADMDGIQAVQYDMPYYTQNVSWREWCDINARLFAGKKCAMNAPTTQVCCHGSTDDVEGMVKDFIEATLPHTTAVVMPGCEIDSYSPVENVKAMIDAARRYGRK